MGSNVIVWQLILVILDKLLLIVQMYRPCQHIIIFQIMIDMAKLHPILIYKHEMDLKLYALAFKVGKCITKMFLFFQI
jgi:hypothetical protein